MDQKIITYLKRIINTLVSGLLWMATNSTLGILKGYAFFEGKIQWQNITYYIFFIISLTIFLWYIDKIWNKPINFEEL